MVGPILLIWLTQALDFSSHEWWISIMAQIVPHSNPNIVLYTLYCFLYLTLKMSISLSHSFFKKQTAQPWGEKQIPSIFLWGIHFSLSIFHSHSTFMWSKKEDLFYLNGHIGQQSHLIIKAIFMNILPKISLLNNQCLSLSTSFKQ